MIANCRRAALLVAVLSAFVAVRAIADGPANAAKPPADDAPVSSPPKVLITISKETTRITGLLRKDGYVDYVAAEDQHAGKGVTAENNASVLIWKAFGPGKIQETRRGEYFKRLGIPPVPSAGEYFVSLGEYLQGVAGQNDGRGVRPARPAVRVPQGLPYIDAEPPWSHTEVRALARWCAANESSLAILVEASKRPRRYDPSIAEPDQPLSTIPEPALLHYRAAAKTLAARAMLRVNEANVDAAWSDLLAVHRLARLAGQGQTVVDCITAATLDRIASTGDQVLLQHFRLSAAAAKRMLDDLSNLPPMPKIVDRIDVSQRQMFLDTVGFVARDGFDGFMEVYNGERDGRARGKSAAANAPSRARLAKIDWDLILRMGNSWYDRTVVAYRKPARAERLQAIKSVVADARKLGTYSLEQIAALLSQQDDPPNRASQTLGEQLVANLLPGVGSLYVPEERAAFKLDLTELGLALAAYRADHGAYPDRLAELAPNYLPTVPQDIYSGEHLHYKPGVGGFLLYSVGENGVDDGGKGSSDAQNGEPWDDISFRVWDSEQRKP